MDLRFSAAALLALGAAFTVSSARAEPAGYGVWNAPDFGASRPRAWQPERDQGRQGLGVAVLAPQWKAISPRQIAVASGGARPLITAQAPPVVMIKGGYDAGTVVVDTAGRMLYLVQEANTAFAYPIGVGREGFEWTGEETISRIADWPDWYPPAEMRQRKRGLPVRMTGGVRNPLGAKALYLGTSLYRIHGTDAPETIGTAQSSGCIRMLNEHVVHLAGHVSVGTKVVVVDATPADFVVARVPEPRPARDGVREARLDAAAVLAQ